MVRFSCFHAHLHKGKKSVQRSAEEMHKILEDRMAMNNPTQLKTEVDVLQNSSEHASESSPNEKDWKSEEIDWKSNGESDSSNNRISHFKKSRSLGSGLNWISKVSNDNDSEDETDRSLIHSEVIVRSNSKDFRTTIPDQSQEAIPSASFRECSISIPEKEGQENSELHLSGVGESSDHAPRTPPAIVRSSSLPNIDFLVCHSTHSLRHSRSVDDVIELAPRHRERSIYDIRIQVTHNDSGIKNGKGNYENAGEDSYYASEYARSAKDWIIPHADNENHQKESLFCRLDELPSKDFKIRRIEDWVKNLQRYPIEEPSSPFTFDELEVPESEGSPVAKLDSNVDPSKEAVKKYISSLSSTSTAAQLSNHGLVVIPFLSALTNLRAINLSGNSIVRITAGSLPRGLHVLNLSKNSISTIEGLKELTRLRVLDLSYNRIFRVGHGLSYCSSLKELYLAGNRISEVEGIHRLLKLNVLDLRFNRISTTKSLGQLAANYNSLQAISLEGNPAHKNIGDEQLKKNLQGLLPHLAYYNRQPIKAGKLKDVADRPTRIGITSRAELKTVRKGSHLAAANNTSSSSARPRRTQAVTSSKASRSRKVRFPPSGTKTGTTRHHVYDFSNKLLNSMPHLSIRRSRSVGTLADT